MKLLEKLENLKIKTKVFILIFLTILVAIFNFVFYNYQSLKLPKDERYYTIEFNEDGEVNSDKVQVDTTIEDDTKKINLDFGNTYVRDFYISYDTNDNFNFNLNGEMANYYGILKNRDLNVQCFSYANECGFPVKTKLQNVTLSINSSVELNKIIIDNSIYFNFITFIFWVLLIDVITVILLFNKIFFEKKHLLSLILSLSIGGMFLISGHNMTSPGADDHIHFSRVNMIVSEKSAADDILENLKVVFYNQDTRIEKKNFQNYLNELSKEKDTTSFNSTSLLSNNLNYIPMGLTKLICTKIGLSYTTSIFVARVVNLLIYSLIIMLAVKIIPTLKLFTLLIGILPQSLFLATNFSYDPTVTAFLTLAFATFVKEYHNKKEKINKKNIAIFLLASMYGCFPKLIYAPIVLLLLLLPKEKFNSKKQCIIFRIAVIIFFFALMSSVLLSVLIPSNLQNMGGDSRGGDTSAARQISMIFSHPVSFLRVLWESMILNISESLFSEGTFFLMTYYGGVKVRTSYYLLLFSLIAAFISEKKYSEIKSKHKLMIILIVCSIIGLIYGSMYLSFTPVGETSINGVQGRYFIPLIIPIIYCLSSSKLKNSINERKATILCSIMALLSASLVIYLTITKIYCL